MRCSNFKTIAYNQNQMLPNEQQSADRFRAAHFAHLKHLAMFALVVEGGSFTTAGQRLGIGKSSVSRHISELETFIGAKLLHRSTRSLSLTDEGRKIFRDCAHLVEAATSAFDRLDGDLPLQGTLKIASTVEHGQYVLPRILSEFVGQNPNIDIELVLGDNFVDLVDMGIDLAIRVGSPGPSPQNISRKIAELQYQLYGNKDFLEQIGPIRTPADAAKHPWLLNSKSPTPDKWGFEKNGKVTTVTVPSRVISNAFNARIEMAKHGQHLIAVPTFIGPEFLGPQIVPILPDYKIVPSYAVYAVYPDARFLSPKVSEFLDLLTEKHP